MERVRQKIDSMKDNLINTIREIVAVESVGGPAEPGAPFGRGPRNALGKFVEISQRMGFRTGIFKDQAGWGEMGDAKAEMVGILSHMDVVPAGEGWECDPWKGQVKDGMVWGRGVADDKGEAICSLFAMKALQEAGVKLKRRVRVIVGTNEELGSKAIANYVKSGTEDLPVAGFTPDAEFPLINGEKGIMTVHATAPFEPSGDVQILSFDGGVAANAVPSGAVAELKVTSPMVGRVRRAVADWAASRDVSVKLEEISCDLFKLTVTGLAMHGARPQYGGNAVAEAVKLLRLMGVSGEQGQFLQRIDTMAGTECFGVNLGLCRYDDESGFSSLCWGIMKMRGKEVYFTLNYRFPVTLKRAPLAAQLEAELKAAGFHIESMSGGDPLYVPVSDPLVVKLMKAYVQETGRKDEKPFCIGGGTYAKEMPHVVAFGCCFPGENQHIHEINERWSIDNIVLTTKIIAAAIVELAGVEE